MIPLPFPKTWRDWSNCQRLERHPIIVFFLSVISLDPTLVPTFYPDTRFKNIISSDTDVTVVAAETKAKGASAKCLIITKPITSLLSFPSYLYPYPHAPCYDRHPSREDEAIRKPKEGGGLRTNRAAFRVQVGN